MPRRYFTLDEANALLPTLRPILQKIAEKHRELRDKREGLAVFRHRAAGNGHHLASADFLSLRKEAEFIGEELQAEIQKVQGLGCLLKDLDLLLVDFPALRAGREILLCWKADEDQVAFWHGTEEGYAGRKPLEGAD
ncbi:MAG TPA: DUF2203 domain-containing protein [Candidatus Methylomirabilis sp.]|nr:DUF2203 domain-containing protein [Candidatus Methylomirabilis sp.]